MTLIPRFVPSEFAEDSGQFVAFLAILREKLAIAGPRRQRGVAGVWALTTGNATSLTKAQRSADAARASLGLGEDAGEFAFELVDGLDLFHEREGLDHLLQLAVVLDVDFRARLDDNEAGAL